jgi:phosphoribosylformylglycinamidine cyclo-ligase
MADTPRQLAKHVAALERAGIGSSYDLIARDTVAMIVNDLITVGALPVSVAMHVAVGSNDWFSGMFRVERLVQGWRAACDDAGCAWGGGETPTLKGIVMPDTALLSGSAWGLVKPKSRLLMGANIRAGDAVVLLTSNGIHANGLSLARKIAERLPEGYATELESGNDFGDELLKPTHIYVGLMRKLFDAGIDLHYAVNITGHGWRKLMRAGEPFSYEMISIPEVQEVFRFIQKMSGNTEREMYGDYNMGAGFALILPRDEAGKVLRLVESSRLGYRALMAGMVKKHATRRVLIRPKNIEFTETDLQVR